MTILERFVKSFLIFKHHSSCYIWWKKTKATCIICRKESKGLGPFKSRYTRHSIAANMSLLVKKCIFIGKNMYRITQCKLKKTVLNSCCSDNDWCGSLIFHNLITCRVYYTYITLFWYVCDFWMRIYWIL